MGQAGTQRARYKEGSSEEMLCPVSCQEELAVEEELNSAEKQPYLGWQAERKKSHILDNRERDLSKAI